MDGVFQNVSTFVVTIDVRKVESGCQQWQRSPGFRFQFANLTRTSQLADVAIKTSLNIRLRPRVDAGQRCVRMREKVLSDPEGATAFMAANLQATNRSPGKVTEVFLPEFGMPTVPVACELQGCLPVQLNSARGRCPPTIDLRQ